MSDQALSNSVLISPDPNCLGCHLLKLTLDEIVGDVVAIMEVCEPPEMAARFLKLAKTMVSMGYVAPESVGLSFEEGEAN